MGCNCKVTDSVLAIVILVFAIWPTLVFPAMVSKGIIIVAAVLLLIYAHKCNACAVPMDKKVSKKKKK